jgi:adenylate cyclase
VSTSAGPLRRLRLFTGLVLFGFVATHLLNHALGLISLAMMEVGRLVFLAFWRNPAISLLLQISLTIHLALAFWSLYRRRSLRLPVWEALQLALGLFIPLVLVEHFIATHQANAQFGYQDSYSFVLLVMWSWRPEVGAWQAVLLLVAWSHGCIGLHFWLRLRPWYQRVKVVLYTVAVLLPVLALLGFAQAGRFVEFLATDPLWVQQARLHARQPDGAEAALLREAVDSSLMLFAGLLALTCLARLARGWNESRHSIRIAYPGQRVVSVPIGYSVLEASRQFGIPHASICGGRGRCSTCRVHVHKGAEALPAASLDEQRVLARIGAGPGVRLACQLRPLKNLSVLPLVPPQIEPSQLPLQSSVSGGAEREVCVLFADLRGFTSLSEQRLPYDVVFLLNRYFEAMGDAVDRAGGIANQFTGDGVMALFGVHSDAGSGARDALRAAQAMQAALTAMNDELRDELPAPLKLGIGIHCGPTVVGHMGRGVATYLTAVGDTVNTAARLQDQTKVFDCQLVVSEQLVLRAGLDTAGMRREQVAVRNRAGRIGIFVVEDVRVLR